jgi:hypothetical protein
MTLVGDAERDRALALLRRHYAEGRLDPDELTRRVHVAASARSTADVHVALRGLPNAFLETAVLPRILAATPALRGAGRVALAAILSALWACATLSLLIVFGILALVSGLTLLTVGAFAVCWALVTLASWRLWRRGSLPFRHRGG